MSLRMSSLHLKVLSKMSGKWELSFWYGGELVTESTWQSWQVFFPFLAVFLEKENERKTEKKNVVSDPSSSILLFWSTNQLKSDAPRVSRSWVLTKHQYDMRWEWECVTLRTQAQTCVRPSLLNCRCLIFLWHWWSECLLSALQIRLQSLLNQKDMTPASIFINELMPLILLVQKTFECWCERLWQWLHL